MGRASILERTSLVFELADAWSVPLAILLLAAFATVALLVLLAWRSSRGATRGRRAVLLAMRSALAIAVVLLALQPVLERESVAVTSAPVAVLVDTSASMSVRGRDGATRAEHVANWMREHRSALDAVAARTPLDVFATADGAVRAISREQAEVALPSSGGTDLLASLNALAERYEGQERPAVVLLSDGGDHGEIARRVDAGEGASALGALLLPGGRIIAIAPASSDFSDIAVELVAHDPVGFLRNDVTVRARVRGVNVTEGERTVSLLQGDRVLQVATVRLGDSPGEGGDATGSPGEVTFKFKPSRVGEGLYRVQVPVESGEAVPANNEAALSVRVVRDRVRVLQIAGRPSWDGRFLRELLKRDPATDLISFFILRSVYDDTNADTEELSLIPFPVSELFDEKLRSFDLLIFQNFSFSAHGIEPYLDVLRKHVEDGAGLLIIGGDLSLRSDYRGPDMAPLVPVRPGAARWIASDVKLALTAAGSRHPVLQLADEGTAESVLATLQPVTGHHAGLVPSGSAQVLLETATPEQAPVLIAGEAGSGRVLLMATDGTWRWSLPTAGRTGSARAYERFWTSAMHWLVRDERSTLLVLEVDRREVGTGEAVQIRARMRRPDYEPDSKSQVTFLIRDAGGATVMQSQVATDEQGIAALAFEPPAAGMFEVTATSGRGSAGPLHVERVERTRELADAAVRRDVLEMMAEATGGEVRELDAAARSLPLGAERRERIESSRTIALWRTWPAWAIVAGLACVEWWLRRRWGLA